MKFIIPQVSKKQMLIGICLFTIMSTTAGSVVFVGKKAQEDISVVGFLPESIIRNIPISPRSTVPSPNEKKVNKENTTPSPEPSPTPTATTQGSSSGSNQPPASTQTPIPTPTSNPTPTPTATPTPNPTSTPSPQPSPTPNPPMVEIVYPSEMLTITIGIVSEEPFCLVERPTGGNTQGLQRKYSLNNQPWTEYHNMNTLCIEPQVGLNSIKTRYRNDQGEESPEYTRLFVIVL